MTEAATLRLFVLSMALSGVLSLLCVRLIWRSRASTSTKAIWTVWVLVPVLGPASYAIAFDPPPVQPEGLRATESALSGGDVGGGDD